MFKFILKKLSYAFSILFGVLTLTYTLFYWGANDEFQSKLERNQFEAGEKMYQEVDKGYWSGYLDFLNNLSPISFHHEDNFGGSEGIEATYHPIANISLGKVHLLLKGIYLHRSLDSNRLVSEVIFESFPGTLILAVLSMFLATIGGMSLGLIHAYSRERGIKRLIEFFTSLGSSLPTYFIAVVLIWVLSSNWRNNVLIPYFPFIMGGIGIIANRIRRWMKESPWKWNSIRNLRYFVIYFGVGLVLWIFAHFVIITFNIPYPAPLAWMIKLPGTGLPAVGDWLRYDLEGNAYMSWKNAIIPAVTLAIRPMCIIAQLSHVSIKDLLNTDMVQMARAKGLSRARITIHYVVKNAFTPILTTITGWFASLLAGAVFVEMLFGWRGIGYVVFTALQKEDFTVVIGAVILIAVIFILINILVDILYVYFNPSLRNQEL